MKKTLFIVLFSIFCIVLSAQRKTNIGFATGAASYMGDINPQKFFYSPSLYYGIIYRYNINKRFALRFNGFYTTLKGNITDFPSNNNIRLSVAEFSTNFIDLASQMEFNFFPYIPNEKKWTGTFYVSGGVAYALMINATSTDAISFPFGAGYKLTITQKISTGIEYTFRRSFSDNIDNIDPLENVSQSLLHNNDWYNYLGIFITYKFVNFAVDCPAYK